MDLNFTEPGCSEKQSSFFQKHPTMIFFMRVGAFYTFLVLFSIQLLGAHSGRSQALDSINVTIEMRNENLKKLFKKIEGQTGLMFAYQPQQVDSYKSITLSMETRSVKETLDLALEGTPLKYRQVNNSVIIFSQEEKSQMAESEVLAITVTGTVRDEGGNPIPGVNIIEKGTTNGTTTDAEGKYTLAVLEDDAVLVFSFIGYITQEMAVNGRSVVDVTFAEDAKSLEEVVVVGYGVQKKESLTSAISNITAEQIQTTTHSSLAQSLQGKIAGMQIRQNSGEPGDFNTMINIRGFGSPLYVIDGVARDGGNEFQRINPEDIESISVLKDASAAIYGLNAANGVIIVTTKKGKKGKPKFQYNGVAGVQYPTNVPRMANAAEWMEMRNDADVNIGKSPYLPQDELQKYQQGISGYESTNWYKETMKKSAMQLQHNISAQGGSDAVTYFVSMGYVKEDGLIKTNDINYERYTFRTNLTANLTKNLVADINITGRYDTKTTPGESFFSIFRGTISSLPTHRPYANDNPDYPALVTDGQSINPVALSSRAYTGYTENKNKFFQSSMALTYEVPFVKGLKIKGLAAFDSNNSFGKALLKSFKLYTFDASSDSYIPTELRKPASISNSIGDGNRVTLQTYLLYNTTIADNHNLDVTLVYEQRKGWSRGSYLRREYAFYTVDQIDMAGLNNQQTGGMESQTGSRSYLGRITYDYKNKYLIEVASRYDGSYRYHPDKRWGLFPVVSGGWRISEENFFKNNIQFISDLKFRASYGIVGEDAGNPFQYVPGFSTSGGGGYEFINGNYTTGVASPAVVNENLTWNESSIKDIGIDVSILNGKVAIEFDVYQRDRTGLLAVRNVSLPNTFGGTLPQENLNSDRVRGIEFSVAHNNTIGSFQYGIRGNFNFARTMNVYVERGPFVSSWDRWRNGRANRWNDIVWMYDLEGQFQSEEEVTFAPLQNGNLGNTRELPGDFRYKDVNGDGVINGNDIVPIAWGGNPKLHYGLTLEASWKGFDFNALFQGSGKYSIRFTHAYATLFWAEGNHPAYFHDRWHKADPYNPDNSEWVPGNWPASRLTQDMGAIYAESPAWRKDASYGRLKSVELGYTLTPQVIRNLGLNHIRVYANAHNVFTIADEYVKAFDPEKIEGHLNTGWVYPLTKSYNLGININF